MSSVQQFRLRWNNHQPNFITVFTKLLNSEELVDVTLGAEGQNLQAHKVVLSACSSYFQTLFKMNPCKHPIVILKDVKYEDLKVIVDFMYYGEVNVSQEQLPAILKTAEVLKVKGLAEMPEANNISFSKSRSLSSDKGDEASVVNAECSSAWGSDSARQSPSPLPTSPSVRRKRLRKASTGSGSGSTERTSERTIEELSLDVNMVKTEPSSFQSEGESVRSNSSLRNSLQEASTESEPPDGLHDSNDEPPNMHSSEESATGPPIEANPGPSTAYNPGQGLWLGKTESVGRGVPVPVPLPLALAAAGSAAGPGVGQPGQAEPHDPQYWTSMYRTRWDPTGRARLVDSADGRKLLAFGKEVPEGMCRALRAVVFEGVSINRAATECGVSASTLWRYLGIIPACIEENDFRAFLQDFPALRIPVGNAPGAAAAAAAASPATEANHSWHSVSFEQPNP